MNRFLKAIAVTLIAQAGVCAQAGQRTQADGVDGPPASAAAAPRPANRPAFSIEAMVAMRNLGQFVLSPDRGSVVFTRVGRYFGHPLFPAFGEDSNLTLKRLDDGREVRLTSGSNAKTYPVFSPDGGYLSYESQGDIWSVDVGSGTARRLTTNVAADRSSAWAPDGREIAFASARWGRPAIYVMASAGERRGLRKISPDGINAAGLVWSRDSKHILFTAAGDPDFYSRGVYRVPAAGGTPKRITPDDSARNAWPSFSPDGAHVAYVSDRSGYANIWLMRPDGSGQRQVTVAVEDQDYLENDYIQTMGLRWSPDGRRILYFTNQLGNLRLMTVDVKTGRTSLIEGQDGSHHPVGWLDDRTVAYVHESYKRPPDLYVKKLGGRAQRITYSDQAALKEENLGRAESAIWTSADGVSIHGFLRRPSWMKDGDGLPGLVVSHTYNVGQFYNQWNPIFAYLAESGYVLLMVNHRGSSGYGTKFRDFPKGNWGFAQLKDIESGAGYLRGLKGVDPAKVGMLGYSMGGYLTQLALTTKPTLFKAGVVVFGLGEIVGDPEQSSPNYIWHLGGTQLERLEAYRNASPVTHVANLAAPMLIIHSDRDPIEPVTKVHNFTQAMDEHEKTYEVKIYENEAHGLRILDHQVDSYKRIIEFLDDKL